MIATRSRSPTTWLDLNCCFCTTVGEDSLGLSPWGAATNRYTYDRTIVDPSAGFTQPGLAVELLLSKKSPKYRKNIVENFYQCLSLAWSRFNVLDYRLFLFVEWNITILLLPILFLNHRFLLWNFPLKILNRITDSEQRDPEVHKLSKLRTGGISLQLNQK